MKDFTLAVLLCTYAFTGLITFGHAANHLRFTQEPGSAIGAAFAVPLWPFYWSWYLQKGEDSNE